MAFIYEQSAQAISSASSQPCAFNSNVIQGDLLIACVNVCGQTITGISDSQGNIWAAVPNTPVQHSSVGPRYTAMYWAVAKFSAADTVIITYNMGSTGSSIIEIASYTPSAGTVSISGSGINFGTSVTSLTATIGPTVHSSDLLVAFCSSYGGNSAPGYTPRQDFVGAATLSDSIASSAGAQSITETCSGFAGLILAAFSVSSNIGVGFLNAASFPGVDWIDSLNKAIAYIDSVSGSGIRIIIPSSLQGLATTVFNQGSSAFTSLDLEFDLGNFQTANELLFTVIPGTGKHFRIRGSGAGTFFTPFSTNRIFHVQETSGQIPARLAMSDFSIDYSSATGMVDSAIYLDSIAIYDLQRIYIEGALNLTNGLKLAGAQQGHISGVWMQDLINGILLASGSSNTSLSANLVEIHGCTINCNFTANPTLLASSAGILVDITGSGGLTYNIHDNNVIESAYGLRNLTPEGAGGAITNNGFDGYRVAGIVSGGETTIRNNGFVPVGATTDIHLLSGASNSLIDGNGVRNILLDSGTSYNIVANNSVAVGGSIVDNDGRNIVYNNRDVNGGLYGSPVVTGAKSGNAAVTSVITTLSKLGFIIDQTT